jgi:hypothetical protein
MNSVFSESLFYIYFVYGVSFLVMSFVVLKGIKKATAISLITTFYALAAFGITHGITELIDWARFILKVSGHGEVVILKYLSQSMLIVSFAVLLQFAVNLFTYKSQQKASYRAIPSLLFVVYLLVLFITKTGDISKAALIARHGLGFSGALLSGIALFYLANSMKAVGDSTAIRGLLVSAIGFGLYAVFAGLIIQPIAGLPVQLFRAACAFTIAISSFYFLGVFEASESD